MAFIVSYTKTKEQPQEELPPMVDLFSNGSALCEISLNENFLQLADNKGFGFASFVSRFYSEDIFVSHRATKLLLNHREAVMEQKLWAEVSCKEDSGKKKYRVEFLWLTLDDVIKAKTVKNKHISTTAQSIKTIDGITKTVSEKKVAVEQYEDLIDTAGDYLSAQKQAQLNLRVVKEGPKPSAWVRHNTYAYTYAEYIVEKWTKDNNLSFHDYNETNQFAPQDCSINNIDIDVKSVIGVGRRIGTQYSSIGDKGEVLIGVQTHTENLNNSQLSLRIDGVFDSKQYSDIDIPLRYLQVNTAPNVCYFSSLFYYFFKSEIESADELIINDTVFQHLLDNHLLGLLITKATKDIRESLLNKLVSKQNQPVKVILTELIVKDRLELFTHYLADYIIGQIVNKTPIDTENIKHLLTAIGVGSTRKNKFIYNLLKAYDCLDKVRCHWHPEETIKDMGIDIYYRDTSHVPIFRAVCSCDPKLKTTFFTYSWKTNKTLVYQNDNDICDQYNCGCLLHSYNDFHSKLGVVLLGKSSCLKYGKSSYEQWVKVGKYPDEHKSLSY